MTNLNVFIFTIFPIGSRRTGSGRSSGWWSLKSLIGLKIIRNVKICILFNIYYIINRFVTNSHFLFFFLPLIIFSFSSFWFNLFQTWRSSIGEIRGSTVKHLLLMHFPSKSWNQEFWPQKQHLSGKSNHKMWKNLHSSIKED